MITHHRPVEWFSIDAFSGRVKRCLGQAALHNWSNFAKCFENAFFENVSGGREGRPRGPTKWRYARTAGAAISFEGLRRARHRSATRRPIGKISAKCCSFSAVSAPIFARKYAFCSIFQNLPDYPAEIFESWQFLQILQHLRKILLNFHENCCVFRPIFCENFEIAAVQKYADLVELEKCCRTHILIIFIIFSCKFRFDTAENAPAKNLQLFVSVSRAETSPRSGSRSSRCCRRDLSVMVPDPVRSRSRKARRASRKIAVGA